MAKSKATIIKHDTFAGMPKLGLLNLDHKPSWRTFQGSDDFAVFEVYAPQGGKFLSIDTLESAGMGALNRNVTRRAMMTVDEKGGRALLAFLKKIYGEG